MDAVRTPDNRFENLPGWDFAPNYVEDLAGYAGLRVHYVDEGPKDADRVFLCLHGQPSWSFLYRKMIPEFVASGARVIAPDWLGFGRSDKPTGDEVYTYNFHRDMIIAFIKRLDLKNITLVVQDWGGVLGLTLPHAMPDRISRLLIMNTAIAIGTPAGKGFNDWRAYNKANPDMDIAALMARATPILTKGEAAAYGAPFPDITFKAGVRRFPDMVMTDPEMEGVEHSKAALAFYQKDWAGKRFMAIGMQDPVLGPPVMEWLKSVIKGCPEPIKIADGGHFVQEWGRPIATAAMKHWGDI
ncbi:MAG: haloalkane dehalogenase [Amylibacter sp.]